MKQINLTAFVLIALGGMIVGFVVGRGTRPKPEVIREKEIQVVRDTVEANMLANQAAALRKELDETKEKLKSIPIKYVTIYKTLPNLTAPEIDSVFDRAVRLDN